MVKEDFLEEAPILGHRHGVPFLLGSSPCEVPPALAWPLRSHMSLSPQHPVPARSVLHSTYQQACNQRRWLRGGLGRRREHSGLFQPSLASWVGPALPSGSPVPSGLTHMALVPVTSSCPSAPGSCSSHPIPAGWRGQPQALEASREAVQVSRK